MTILVSLFFVIVTLFVIGFLWWNMTKGDVNYTNMSVTPGVTQDVTIPPQLDVPKTSKTVSKQTIRNLNRLYGNGLIPNNSDYANLKASGKVYWNPNVGSWQATSGEVIGYTGVGNPTAMDISNLNRMYGSGRVSPGSRLAALANSNKVKFTGGKWISNVNIGSAGAQNEPSAAQGVTNQTIRNLNRMYGNGQIPITSDYANLYTSGKVYWNPNINSWQATSGKAVGYTGIGNPNVMDIQNLNRLYPNGRVPSDSRFAALANSNKVKFSGGKWISNVNHILPPA